MSLTNSQNKTVSEWVTEGKSVAEIQRLLLEDFSTSMTYMEVRFLIDDLDVAFVEPEADKPEKTDDESEVVETTLHQVDLDIDAVTPPGALMSGRATFSDGVTMEWQLASNGRLGLIPGENGDYRPSAEDMQDFRVQMDAVLRKKGFTA